MNSEDFEAAKRSLRSGDIRASLCDPFLFVWPVDGVSVSILAGEHGQSTVCASDETAARLDELQFDLGEGPCWEAMVTRSPVFTSRLGFEHQHGWPAFAEALRTDEQLAAVESMHSFPLTVGALDVGAVDLWSSTVVDIHAEKMSEISELAALAAWEVLRRIFRAETDEQISDDSDFMSRREVHQATGMILSQMGVAAAEAALLLRAYAFANSRSVREVAADVVSRSIDFSNDP